MPTRLVFRCNFCRVEPDAPTSETLQRMLQLMLFGEYLDSEPDGWLVWTGRGVYGPAMYACPEHREALKTHLRKHYGGVGFHPWAKGPHPAGWHFRDSAEEVRRKRRLASRPGHFAR